MFESVSVQTGQGRSCSPWRELAEKVLDGHRLSAPEGLAVLSCRDEELLDLLAAAYRVRYHYFGNTVQLHFLMNAKSGLCSEDCSYCSQSRISQAEIPRYRLLDRDEILAGARRAQERGCRTYCIVISARGPSEGEMQAVEAVIPEIKQFYPLKVCTSLGLLTAEQAQRLRQCGVDRVNHNVNTSPDYYSRICSTHTYQERIATLSAVRDAGLELCSGGIIGMGEDDADVVRMALVLRDLGVESVPLNFLHPIAGTPLEDTRRLTPRHCLKALALFRLALPDRELRIAGGRELHLRSMQCLGLYAANSLFVGDYLTTKGQPPEDDYRMLEDMGFEIARSTMPGA